MSVTFINLEEHLGQRYNIVEESFASKNGIYAFEVIVEFDGTIDDQYCVRLEVEKDKCTKQWEEWAKLRMSSAIKNYFEPDHLLTQYEDMIKELNDKASD